MTFKDLPLKQIKVGSLRHNHIVVLKNGLLFNPHPETRSGPSFHKNAGYSLMMPTDDLFHLERCYFDPNYKFTVVDVPHALQTLPESILKHVFGR